MLGMPDAPELPSRDVMAEAFKVVHDHADRIYVWNYERSREQLVKLYNRGAASQWQSATDLDWSTEVDPEKLGRPRHGAGPALPRGRPRSRAPRSPAGARRSTSRSGSSS